MRRIGLIATVFNEGRSVVAFLESIARGTLLPDEFVIVDGGSTDNTAQLVSEFFDSNPHINGRVIKSTQRLNIAAGRNVAISACECEVIAATDAGCVVGANWLEEIVRPLADASVDVVGGWYEALPGTQFQKLVAAATIPNLSRINALEFLPSSRSIAFRKSCWAAVAGYPEWLTFAGEDTLFDISMKKAGFRFSFVATAVVYWEMRPDLRTLMRQYYRYGVGDGEADILRADYLKRLAAIVFPFLLLVSSRNPKQLLVRYAVVIAQTAGWVRGRARKRLRRRTSSARMSTG